MPLDERDTRDSEAWAAAARDPEFRAENEKLWTTTLSPAEFTNAMAEAYERGIEDGRAWERRSLDALKEHGASPEHHYSIEQCKAAIESAEK